jgi:glucokinase
MRLIGIDLGGTAIKAGAADEHGTVLDRRSIPTGLQDGADAVIDRMAGLARAMGAERCVGVGSPGLIDHAGGRVLECPNLKALEYVPLRDELARRLEFDPRGVVLENDANAAAVGENWLGAGREHEDLLMVTLGTGVGGGLILAGELYAGPGGMAGEIGHVCIDPEGPWCGCGRRGCVEQYASATAAKRRARELGLPADSPGDLVRLSAIAARTAGPERDLCTAIGRDLGRGLAMTITLLDLRCFVIGGGFGAALEVLRAGIHAGIAERTYGRRIADVKVLPAELGADAGWIGAARLAARAT